MKESLNGVKVTRLHFNSQILWWGCIYEGVHVYNLKNALQVISMSIIGLYTFGGNGYDLHFKKRLKKKTQKKRICRKKA